LAEWAKFLLLTVEENNKNVKTYNEINSSSHIFLGERIPVSDVSTFPRDAGSLAHVVTTQPAGVSLSAAGSPLFTGVGAVRLQSSHHGGGLTASPADQTSAQSC